MDISINSPNAPVTESIREYVDNKVGKLDRFYDGIHHGVVTLRNTDNVKNASAELVFSVARGNTLVAHAEHEDMYAAIDLAVDKMKRNLRRFNGKIKNRRSGAVEAFPSPLKEKVVVDSDEETE